MRKVRRESFRVAARRAAERDAMRGSDATLTEFRRLADAMAGDTPRDWQWIGQHMSQRMFGITEQRARDYAARHGGTASRMS